MCFKCWIYLIQSTLYNELIFFFFFFIISVADPDNFASDPVFKIPYPDPDPTWISSDIENLRLFCIFILFKVKQDIYLEVIIYKNRILPYYTCFNKKKSSKKFRYDFLIFLVDDLLFKDPDQVFILWILIRKSGLNWKAH